VLGLRRSFVVTFCVAAGCFVAGCGGSGGGSSSTPNPFAGAYAGNDGNGDTFLVVVSSTGQMTGSDSTNGTVTGSITSAGNESFTYTSGNGSIVVTA
jgi:hypothetical protein